MKKGLLLKLDMVPFIAIEELVERLRLTNSKNEKEQILKGYEDATDVKKYFYYLYNPFFKYGVSETKLMEILEKAEQENKDISEFEFNTFYEFLETLSKNNINDYYRDQMGILLNNITDDGIRDLVICILTKDLRAGVGSKTIEKVFKGLLPKHEVQLAKKYEPGKTKLKGQEFHITEKLDGIRCTAYFEGDELKIKTRQGKDIEGLVEIEKTLKDNKEIWENHILDGELISIGSKPEDVYKHTMEKVQNKNKEKTGVVFKIFDMVSLEHFLNKKSTTNYSIRRKNLSFIKNMFTLFETDFVKLVPILYSGSDENVILPLLDKVVSEGKEGLMLNLDKPYEFKRTSNLLKVKKMFTMDLKVVGFEEGTGKNKDNLGALLVDYKGNKVGVGSGLTDHLRKKIWENKEEYLGRIAEIQYFEISKDKNGVESLRFPVLKTFREEGKEVSYY